MSEFDNSLSQANLGVKELCFRAQMEKMGYKIPQCMTPKESYTIDYPEAIEFAVKQTEAFWSPLEITVEKDVQSILVDCTEAERHGVTTGLRLFTSYELKVGVEHWGRVIMDMFPRPDIQRMANCLAFMELGVHAPFYNEVNKAMNLATDEFYLSYVNDPILSARMAFIDAALDSNDPLINLGTFAMIEGGVLYSNFAYFKSFQSQGKNKINNIVAGINFSVRDENLHHLAGCWLFRLAASEMGLTPAQMNKVRDHLVASARVIREHEHRIIEMLFEKGPIDGLSEKDMKTFIDSRLNLCLENLGFTGVFAVGENPIAEWFYKGITSYIMHDFFNRVGNQYSRGWEQSRFIWTPKSLAA